MATSDPPAPMQLDRRRLIHLAALACSAGVSADATAQAPALRPIPRAGGALVPLVGMGSWLTFDVSADDLIERTQRRRVLERFFAAGGGMIDSSPMYGRAERLIGELIAELRAEQRDEPPVTSGRGGAAATAALPGRLFTATKIWTPFDAAGASQFDASLRLWRVAQLDLVLVHNLLNWPSHLKLLRRAKDDGRVRAIGVSTSHGRDHDVVERLLRREPLDAIQITYNFSDPSAERVMNLAAERGVAVIINRPFDGGALFSAVRNRRLPAFAADIDCSNWAQFFLKWVVAHPAVTCAIPATSNPLHMVQNMGAGIGRLPDATERRRMQSAVAAL
jgi:diketogulonate reductase-like aldo/keto reductase